MEKQGPQSGVAPFPAAAVEPPPNPGSTSAGSVCVSAPANGATVNSPMTIQAATTLTPIDHMRVYVDGRAEYFTWFNSISDLLWLAPGPHTLEVLATDTAGHEASTTVNVNVSTQQPAPVSEIQNLPLWDPCSAVFPPGHPRAGQLCAAGLGTAVSTITQKQSMPSLSGSSAKFTMGGPAGYSNMLWTKYLGGGSAPTHFIYDLSFYIDHPEFAQALEFDVNQTFGGNRWVFGTECNLKADGVFDVWDGVKGWQPTTVPCKSLPANQWIHLVWTFERVGNQVHYISVQLNGTTYPLDLYKSFQPGWVMEGIDVAFQMDGDFRQDPYNVWLDNVTLTAY